MESKRVVMAVNCCSLVTTAREKTLHNSQSVCARARAFATFSSVRRAMYKIIFDVKCVQVYEHIYSFKDFFPVRTLTCANKHLDTFVIVWRVRLKDTYRNNE